MNPNNRRLQIAILILTLLAVCDAQTAGSHQNTASKATSSVTGKPLSFFVGGWEGGYKTYGGYSDAGAPIGDGTATTVAEGSYHMFVEPSGQKDELQVSLVERYDWYDNRFVIHNPQVINRASESKGRIVKLGPDYKYIPSMEGITCKETVTNRTDEDKDEKRNCTPDQKTYTLKILSQDEIVLVYKPDGSEQKLQRE